MRRGYLRNFIFGAEDSLVSTVGLLSGISFAGFGSSAIVLSGLILILVEAISMAAGVYLSEDSANELPASGQKDNTLVDSAIMLVSYLLIGAIPLLPYVLLPGSTIAFHLSVVSSLIALFAVGVIKGLFVQKSPLYSGLKLAVVGGVVILIAILVGGAVKA